MLPDVPICHAVRVGFSYLGVLGIWPVQPQGVRVVSPLLRVSEVARAGCMSESSVRRLIARGDLESVLLGPRTLRVWADSVDRLLSRGWRPAGGPGGTVSGGLR